MNIDDFQGLAMKFRINSIPTLLIFKGGQVVNQLVGAKGKKVLKDQLDLVSA